LGRLHGARVFLVEPAEGQVQPLRIQIAPMGYQLMPRSRILVTGGAGYIGSHACKALAAPGYEPVTYDNLSRGNRWAVKWGPLEEGEIADGARLRTILDRYQAVAVMHFAAFAYVGESVEQPLLYCNNNVGGSIALLARLSKHAPFPWYFHRLARPMAFRNKSRFRRSTRSTDQSIRLFEAGGRADLG
jgi:hypothetical protein